MRLNDLILLLATLLLAVTADSTNSSTNSSCIMLKNTDRVGFDLKNVTGTYFTCKLYCDRTPGCVAWVWNNFQGGTCWLKSRAGKLVFNKGALTTNCIRNEPSPVCNALSDVEFVGNDLVTKPGTKFKDCCDICNETPHCKAYSWSEYQGGTCWLKRGIDRIARTRGVVSSVTYPLDSPVCVAEDDTNFVGNDLYNTTTTNPGACCAACKSYDGCKAYSWTTENGGTCYMKKAKGKAVPVLGVVSAALIGV